MAEVNEFVSWAKEKLEAIEELGIQEAYIDKAQELLSDPDLGPSIRNLIKSIRKQVPEGGKGQGCKSRCTDRNMHFAVNDKV